MKAYLQKLCDDAESLLVARHLVREYLQARILQSLQRVGAMQSVAFHGGTVLRFLYNVPRYSEDLDFALERITTTSLHRHVRLNLQHHTRSSLLHAVLQRTYPKGRDTIRLIMTKVKNECVSKIG